MLYYSFWSVGEAGIGRPARVGSKSDVMTWRAVRPLSLGAGQMQSEVSVPLPGNEPAVRGDPRCCLSSTQDTAYRVPSGNSRDGAPILHEAVTGCDRGDGWLFGAGGGELVSG